MAAALRGARKVPSTIARNETPSEFRKSELRKSKLLRNHSSSKPTTAMPHSFAVARMRSSHSVFMWM